MIAQKGDRVVVRGHTVGTPVREAEVLEVRHPDGSPPYVVRWSDSGQEALFFPGADAYIEHAGPGGSEDR
jgi:hypothetical protein